jgi:C1A family cysteine protease
MMMNRQGGKCFLAFAVLCALLPRVVHAGKCSPFDFATGGPNAIGFQRFVVSFKPVFTQNNLTISDRVKLLRTTFSLIKNHNSQNTTSNYTLGINELSAYSQLELEQRNGARHIKSHFADFSSGVSDRFLQNMPASVDWVAAGAVTYVKNQQQCGCCWAVAIAGAIEGAAAIDSGFTYLQSLSAQQLISCDTSSYGCNGGSIVSALEYSMNNGLGGMTTYAQYPFEDGKGKTSTDCKSADYTLAVSDSQPKTVTDIDTGDSFSTRVNKMKQALVSGGPVAIEINANCPEFQSYSSGVFTPGSCTCFDTSCLDHAVLLVGYNDTNDPAYWKVKNSWGECWGEDGYFRVSQEQEGDWGVLGLLAQGVLPLSAYNLTAQVSSAESLFQSAVVVSSGVIAAVLAALMM